MAFAASQQAFAEALLHRDLPVPPGVTTARGEADASRFAVYRNNVFVGLTRALAQRFPVTERLVGAEFFAGMARAFAQDHKPSSPLIVEYGDDFPDFIAGFGPARELPYLPDLASLEAAWTRAYHAEDAAPIPVSALAIDPQALPAARLVPHPSLGLVVSAYPVGSIWAAHQQDEVLPPKVWIAETVLVSRPHMTVGIHILPAPDVPFVEALVAGATLAAAAGAALDNDRDFDFGEALVGLLTLGAFAALNIGERNRS